MEIQRLKKTPKILTRYIFLGTILRCWVNCRLRKLFSFLSLSRPSQSPSCELILNSSSVRWIVVFWLEFSLLPPIGNIYLFAKFQWYCVDIGQGSLILHVVHQRVCIHIIKLEGNSHLNYVSTECSIWGLEKMLRTLAFNFR